MDTPVRRFQTTIITAVGRRDPGFDALRRAIRPAIVVPAAAAVALHIGGSQTPLFTIFGSFALLALADLPGGRDRRAVSYIALGVVGYVFIVVATLTSEPGWLAAASMLVVGVAVTYAAILSASFSAAQRAALLLFVLPVSSPAGPLSDRLIGWTIALAFSIPAALYLLPPRHHNELRHRARAVCGGLADHLESAARAGRTAASAGDVAGLMDRLRQVYLGSDTRPSGLTAGSRAILRVVDDLDWLTSQVSRRDVQLPDDLRAHSVRVLRLSDVVLANDSPGQQATDRRALQEAVSDLRLVMRPQFGTGLDAILADPSDADAEFGGMGLLEVRTICSTIELVGRTVAWASAADARPALQKILGRQLLPTGVADLVLPEFAATRMSMSSTVIRNSVTTRNALRTGVGLAAAVALIQVVPVQHGFWVVLGAMSVLRTSALTTGANVMRAVLGTAVGFFVGALIIAVVGTDHTALWIVLPIATFGAAYIPSVISFAAGQAAFTVLVVALFNVLSPSGWKIGLIRVEDVAIGCAVAVVAAIVMWPRGVAAAAHTAINYAIAVHGRYVRAAAARLTTGATQDVDAELDELRTESLRAYRASDDAARQYLSESGLAVDRRMPVVRAIVRANRLRLVADSIADLTPTADPAVTAPNLCTMIDIHAARVAVDTVDENTAHHPGSISAATVAALRTDYTKNGLGIDEARPLVAAAAFLGELELMRSTRPQ
ncbi:FUSC family protein [Williamsia sp.]|uniref:FUSC family protein n=1 Tax=Williamsia sp. TaxID=1872085 RepID=UPI002F94D5F3